MEFLSQQLNLRITQAAQSNLDRNWYSDGGYDQFCRIYHVTAGKGIIKCSNREMLLEPGFFYLIPSHRHLSYSCRNHIAINWLHIELTISSGIELFTVIDSGIIRMRCPELQPVDEFQRLTVEFPYKAMADMVRGQGMVMQLLASFLVEGRIVMPQTVLVDVTLFDAVMKMISNSPERAWRVEELAAVTGLGRVRFSTEFKRIFGMPPVRFVMLKRIERARHLLLYTDLTIEAIGNELGFHDGFHFSKTFKRIIGLTPKQLRLTGNVAIP